jgi:hypothetical protein
MSVFMECPGEKFLARAGISKEDCRSIAKSLTGSSDIATVPLQGGRSYTVQGGHIVVQFRSDPIDLRIHEQATKIHGTKCILPITCQQSAPFCVYTSPYGGRSCCAKEFRVSVVAQKTALKDLAKELAQSCEHPVEHMDIKLDVIESFLNECLGLPGVQREIQYLIDNLSISFHFQRSRY